MRLRPIRNWRILWWRKFSTHLALMNGFFVTYVFSQPMLVLGLLGFVPIGPFLYVVAATLGLLAFGLPVLVANIDQPKLREKIQGKQDGQCTSETVDG